MLSGRTPESTLHQFLQAVADRDGERACGLLDASGKLAMARYPLSAAGRQTARSCADNVARLDRLPGWRRWRAYAAGRVLPNVEGPGLDAKVLTIEYPLDGIHFQATAWADASGPGVDSLISTPPRPPEADAAAP